MTVSFLKSFFPVSCILITLSDSSGGKNPTLLCKIKSTGPSGRSKDAWDADFDFKNFAAPGPGRTRHELTSSKQDQERQLAECYKDTEQNMSLQGQ